MLFKLAQNLVALLERAVGLIFMFHSNIIEIVYARAAEMVDATNIL